ncbi:7-cyano-7-deazaguanine synthase [Planctomicrobium sp. SH527]|uniref:7-cyano-7-deazaguanine synthase n=1 Tax=Planctomicrobium sp. SH527 TaxID=3448123 RepID=UPI003F5AEF41
MSHHSSRFELDVRDSRWSESKKFRFGHDCDFLCRERILLENVPSPPQEQLLDLVRIASSVFFADRIIKRDRRGGPQAWPRTISLSLEVANPDFWIDANVSQCLHDALHFVSGDNWLIQFLPSTAQSSPGLEWQPPLSSAFFPTNPRFSLYSGGLDSAAGLAHQLLLSGETPIVPITVRHRSDLGDKVKHQLTSMGRVLGKELYSIVVPFEMSSPSKLVQIEETSQRSRAFLFITIGAAVTNAFGASRLETFESGVGAINAPLLAGMDGSQATKGSHPHFLHLMSELLSLVIGSSFQIVLPFMGKTKGELVASLSPSDLRLIANATCSCPSFPVRVHHAGPQQSCGACAACLFRRLAMHSAGIEEVGRDYQYDFLDNQTVIPFKKRRYLAAFLNQVDSLRETELGKLPPNIERHLRHTHVFDHGCSVEMIVDLYRRYRYEWLDLIRLAASNGCKWTKLIDLPAQAA